MMMFTKTASSSRQSDGNAQQSSTSTPRTSFISSAAKFLRDLNMFTSRTLTSHLSASPLTPGARSRHSRPLRPPLHRSILMSYVHAKMARTNTSKVTSTLMTSAPPVSRCTTATCGCAGTGRVVGRSTALENCWYDYVFTVIALFI
ncbi:hypothetical protein K438DRAFT_127036 [Mycena galopus ATCC 62051]|nr:hypothetical protein K438DRAFT_127036 [Mycena galopus ATCC 62051]